MSNTVPSLLGILEHPVDEELFVDLPVVDLLLDSPGRHQPQRTGLIHLNLKGTDFTNFPKCICLVCILHLQIR